MDDFTYQVRLSQIKNSNSVLELVTMFKELFKKYIDTNHLYGDGCINFSSRSSTENYAKDYEAILVSDLLGNIYNRLIDSKQLSTKELKFVISRPFPPIDKEQAIKNIKAFHGLI